MLEGFQNINKAFESKVRLGIMAVLMVNEESDFNTLKELLSLTDGNLASHTRALEELGYIVCKKAFVGRKTKTSFQATPPGKEAFKEHIAALESLLTVSYTHLDVYKRQILWEERRPPRLPLIAETIAKT